jgi:hypothetical protein
VSLENWKRKHWWRLSADDADATLLTGPWSCRRCGYVEGMVEHHSTMCLGFPEPPAPAPTDPDDVCDCYGPGYDGGVWDPHPRSAHA